MEKIVIFIGSLSFGGAERVVSILSESFINHYDEIEIILYYDRPIQYHINDKVKITIIEKEVGTKSKIRCIFWLRNYLINVNPSVILSFLAPFNMFLIISLIGKSIPIIVAERNDPNNIPSNYFMRKLRNFLYCYTKKIIVQTNFNKAYFSKKLHGKIDVIYNPVFMNRELVGSALVSNKENKIVSIGRLVTQKNQKLLIDAFEEVHNDYPNYSLVIYGEGPLEYELKEYINKKGLKDIVRLEGVKKNIFEYLRKSSVFVLSSDFEGMPNALIEAMCLGLPCISTKVSGAVDLIDNNINGILVEKNSKEELAEAIKGVLNDKDKAMLLGKNATLLNNKLDINNISKYWIKSLDDIIKEKRR